MVAYRQDRSLDCTGLSCPMPVFRTDHAIKELGPGQILEMIGTDPGSVPDIQSWAKRTGHELLLAEQQADGKYRFLIRKVG